MSIKVLTAAAMAVLVLAGCHHPAYSQNNQCGNNGCGSAPVTGPFYSYWDLSDNRTRQALPEVASEVNLDTIAEQMPGGRDTQAYAAYNANQLNTLIKFDQGSLLLSQAYGQKAWVALEYVFFAQGAHLYSNWQTRWSQFANQIAAYGSNIVAFTVKDEPYESAIVNNIPIATMQTELMEIVSAVRARFPNVKMACDCQPYTIVNGLSLSMFDWIGFDAYGATAAQLNTYLGDIEVQYQIPASGKRTFIVPDAYAPSVPANPDSPTDPTIETLSAQQPVYETLMNEHPSVVAVIGFIYTTQGGLFGLDKMPTVHALYSAWFQRLAAEGGK